MGWGIVASIVFALVILAVVGRALWQRASHGARRTGTE